MSDLLRLTQKTLGAIDLRVLPTAVAVQVSTNKKLIDQELERLDVPKPEAAKKAKKKAAKKKGK